TTSTTDEMEGVVVSRQILVGVSALTRRPVLETLCNKGLNQRRPRSTTSKPAMASEQVLLQHHHQVLRLLNFRFSIGLNQRRQCSTTSSPQWRQNQFCFIIQTSF